MARKIKEAPHRKLIQWLMVPLALLVVIGGHFWPYFGYIAISMIMIMLVLAMFRGRYYCGWLCAMGAFFERVLSTISLNKNIPPVLRTSWFRWLIFILMMGLLTLRLVMADGDPEKIGATFVMMWSLSTGLAIALGLIWKPRSWCNICPMATFQGLIAPCNYLLQVSSACKECGLCQKNCPIETNPASFKKQGFVKSSECMRCSNCVTNCPQKALKFQNAPKGTCSVLGNLGFKPRHSATSG